MSRPSCILSIPLPVNRLLSHFLLKLPTGAWIFISMRGSYNHGRVSRGNCPTARRGLSPQQFLCVWKIQHLAGIQWFSRGSMKTWGDQVIKREKRERTSKERKKARRPNTSRKSQSKSPKGLSMHLAQSHSSQCIWPRQGAIALGSSWLPWSRRWWMGSLLKKCSYGVRFLRRF